MLQLEVKVTDEAGVVKETQLQVDDFPRLLGALDTLAAYFEMLHDAGPARDHLFAEER